MTELAAPPLPIPEPIPIDAPPPAPPAPRRIGAGLAFLAFFLVFAAQLIAGMVVIIGGIVLHVVQGKPVDVQHVEGIVGGFIAPLLLTSGIASMVMLAIIARAWIWDIVRDRTRNGLGLFVPSKLALIWSGIAGVVIATGYLAVAFTVPADPKTVLGPLARAATSGGWARIAWALLGIVLAPPVEELLFRGIMLRGFADSWGMPTSAIAVTTIFVVLHLPETMHYWPATLFILALAVGTAVARIVTGSVYAALAVHIAYNAVLVAASFAR